jgi:hypothetical protein
MRCCALTRAPALRLLHPSQISGGGSGRREVNEVAAEVGVEAGLRGVTLVGAHRPRRRK